MFKLLNKKKNNKGFTFVELVIVIAILAILVGLLAPQYTKYVEKTRKSADASNMDEIVKVIKVYAADPANELAMGDYVVTIGEGTTTTGTSVKFNNADITGGLKDELDEAVPSWTTLTTKSKKWNNDGSAANIVATVNVNSEGGVSVTYTPDRFNNYMTTGSTDAPANP